MERARVRVEYSEAKSATAADAGPRRAVVCMGQGAGGEIASRSWNLPSVQALTDTDERVLLEELRLLRTKRQLDAMRGVLDELEREWIRTGGVAGARADAAEEWSNRGCRSLLEALAMLRERESGVFRSARIVE